VGVEACPFITDHAQYWALGNTPFERQAVYKQQAEQSLSDEDLRAIRKATLGGWGLGDDEFLERIELIAHRRTRPLSRGRPPKAARPQTD
jgi:putative transposase